ncbi:hypothetical protein [Paraburkholderia sp. J7]|uniref:hypothetical protein n=1 Tax=Paraburkholderia sp. J7 TaxID=2805438 RepID=UPI002AB5EA90|nr:hypothetical protein [Paraburkholderia sp. J7]
MRTTLLGCAPAQGAGAASASRGRAPRRAARRALALLRWLLEHRSLIFRFYF